MEGTHTVLRLYKPIQELCFISLYFSTRKSRGFSRSDQTPREVRPQDEDAKQRSQYYCEETKAAVAQLHWLAAEHHQLLTDLLSLCSDCADRIKMGNQDGKLLDGYGEHGDVNSTVSPSPEHKKAASRVRKLKKLSAEEFLQSKMKKKVQSGASEFSPKAISIREIDTPGSGSYVSVSSEVCEHFRIANDGWDFMEEPRSFESEIDFCAELMEFDNQLTLDYKKPLGNQHGCVQQEIKTNGNIKGNQQSQSSLEINQRDVRIDEMASNEEPISHSSLDHQQAGQEEIKCFTQVDSEKTRSNFSPIIDANSRSSKPSSLEPKPHIKLSLRGLQSVLSSCQQSPEHVSCLITSVFSASESSDEPPDCVAA